jgi:hypothetical protein
VFVCIYIYVHILSVYMRMDLVWSPNYGELDFSEFKILVIFVKI